MTLPTGRDLVLHVTRLAQQVAAGRHDLVGDLADAANQLQIACTRANGSRYLGTPCSNTTGSDRYNLRAMMRPPYSYGGIVVPAGRVRRAFGGTPHGAEQEVAIWLMYLLPTVLPEDDETPVLLHKFRTIYRIFNDITADRDPSASIDKISEILGRTPPSDLDQWLAVRD